MSITCEICGKEFKNSQGLRGHKTFVHQMTTTHDPVTRLATEQQLSKLEDRLSKVEGITDLGEPSPLENIQGSTEKPLAEQVSELTEQVGQLTEQLDALAEKMELCRVTKAMLDEGEAEHERQSEQLRNEWQSAYDNLVAIINRNGELAKEGFSIAEGETKATKRQVNDLMNVVGQLEEQAQSRLALENQLHTKLDVVEVKQSGCESELGVVRNLMRRQPTGELVSFPLIGPDTHEFKTYKSSEGLARPYRYSRDPFFGDRWIDLAEPED